MFPDTGLDSDRQEVLGLTVRPNRGPWRKGEQQQHLGHILIRELWRLPQLSHCLCDPRRPDDPGNLMNLRPLAWSTSPPPLHKSFVLEASNTCTYCIYTIGARNSGRLIRREGKKSPSVVFFYKIESTSALCSKSVRSKIIKLIRSWGVCTDLYTDLVGLVTARQRTT